MPVQLPPQAPGLDADLPPHPNDPPTIDDISLAQDYQRRVEFSGRGKSSTCLQWLHPLIALGLLGGPPPRPSMADIARAEVYKTELVIAHRGV